MHMAIAAALTMVDNMLEPHFTSGTPLNDRPGRRRAAMTHGGPA
jgi:hypothetical protein